MRHFFFTAASWVILSGIISACASQNHEPTSAVRQAAEHAVPEQAPMQGESRDTEAQEPAEAGFALMQSERLGPLRLGLPAGQVLKALGKPYEKSECEVWAADGAEHQQWRYPAQGIVLGMIAEGAGNVQQIDAITISAPCRFRTTRDMGIGSGRRAVLEAYRKEIAQPSGDSAVGISNDAVIAGSVYGGVVFTIKDNKVTGVFIGAGAE